MTEVQADNRSSEGIASSVDLPADEDLFTQNRFDL